MTNMNTFIHLCRKRHVGQLALRLARVNIKCAASSVRCKTRIIVSS